MNEFPENAKFARFYDKHGSQIGAQQLAQPWVVPAGTTFVRFYDAHGSQVAAITESEARALDGNR